jgi:hypothetical protein
MHRSRRFFGVAMALGLFVLGTQPARADILLTKDNPNPTIALPSSGFIDFNFTGTLSFDAGYAITMAQIKFPYIGGNPPKLDADFVNFPYSDALDGGTFVGALLKVIVESTSAIGFYDQRLGGGPATFTIRVQTRTEDF